MVYQQNSFVSRVYLILVYTIISPLIIRPVYLQTPSPSCGSQEAYYANSQDCRSYYYCWNNEVYLQYCPNGLYFHLAGRTCEPAGVADCGGYSGNGGFSSTTTRKPGLFGPSLCTKICSDPDLAKKSPVKGVFYTFCQCTDISTTPIPNYAASVPLTTPQPNVFSIITNFINSIFPGTR
uniref:Chitin-binding type-2 domain-containing protein n=1 Tax=Tetranychus urticae TaxID=32264 RepID=T1KEI2_TETUR